MQQYALNKRIYSPLVALNKKYIQHLTVFHQIWYNCFENVALCNELKVNTSLSYKQAGMLVGNFEKNNKELPKIRFCERGLKCYSPLKRYQF